MRAIVPNLWFDAEAEEAANFYISIFKEGKINEIARYPEAATEVSGKPAGSVLTVDFEIEGNRYIALNGGPAFTFNESVSFLVECADQEEVDYFWERLTAEGGEESVCGWLKDRFGVSWQVVPVRLNEMMADPDPAKVNAVTAAFLAMRKIELEPLERVYAGEQVDDGR